MHIPLINGNNDLEVSSVICKVIYVSMVSNIPEPRTIIICSFQMVRSLLYFTRLTNWHLGKGFEFQTWIVQKTGLLIWCAPKIWYWSLQVNFCAIKPTWQVVQDLHWSWKLFCRSEYSFVMRMPILIFSANLSQFICSVLLLWLQGYNAACQSPQQTWAPTVHQLSNITELMG